MDVFIRQIKAMERMRPLCPDHRDKAKDFPCLMCEIERLRAGKHDRLEEARLTHELMKAKQQLAAADESARMQASTSDEQIKRLQALLDATQLRAEHHQTMSTARQEEVERLRTTSDCPRCEKPTDRFTIERQGMCQQCAVEKIEQLAECRRLLRERDAKIAMLEATVRAEQDRADMRQEESNRLGAECERHLSETCELRRAILEAVEMLHPLTIGWSYNVVIEDTTCCAEDSEELERHLREG